MADMDCPNCEPQSAGSANSARCVAGPRTEVKYFARSSECAGKATLSYTQTDQCVRSGVSIVDENGVVLTQAQYDAIDAIQQPSISFNCGGNAAPAVAEVHKIPATVSIGGVPVVGTGPELQTFDLPAYPVAVAEIHVTPATIFVGGVALVGTGPELQRFDLPAIPVAKTLCELTQDAATSIAVSASQPTDEIVVKRGATCARVPLAALLTDVQISAISRVNWNPVSGQMSLDITESNGEVNSVSFDVTVPSETPLTLSSQSLKITQFGTGNHTATINLALAAAFNNATLGPNATKVYTEGQTVPGETAPLGVGEYRVFTKDCCCDYTFNQCTPANNIVISGSELQASFVAPPVVPTFATAFNVVDAGGGLFSSANIDPGIISSSSIALLANQVILLHVVFGTPSAFADSVEITYAGGAGTLQLLASNLYWRSGGTSQKEVRRKVYLFTPTAAGSFTFSAQGVYTSGSGAGVIRMSGVVVSNVDTSAPIKGSLNFIGNAGTTDLSDPGYYPGLGPNYGLGPQTVTVPNTTASDYSLWINDGRHLKANSVDFAGATEMYDLGGVPANCTLSQAAAYLATNTVTVTTHVNDGGAAQDTFGQSGNNPDTKDAFFGISFNTVAAAPSGGSPELIRNSPCNVEIVNACNKISQVKATLSGGVATGNFQAGAYDIKTVLSTGQTFGPATIIFNSSGTFSVPLPSGSVLLPTSLAPSASTSVQVAYVITGNTHNSANTSPMAIVLTPQKLLLELTR